MAKVRVYKLAKELGLPTSDHFDDVRNPGCIRCRQGGRFCPAPPATADVALGSLSMGNARPAPAPDKARN